MRSEGTLRCACAWGTSAQMREVLRQIVPPKPSGATCEHQAELGGAR
jgi:hypothetical protein